MFEQNIASIQKTAKQLEQRQIKSWIAEDADEARDIVCRIVPADAVVGIGDSTSVKQVKCLEALKVRGNRIINPFDPDEEALVKDDKTHFKYNFLPMMEATICDVFLTGSNAITEDGRIVNIDGSGNRVAGMIWGHPLSIIIIGRNKIVKNLDEALDRVKNVISPEHIKRKGSDAPCAKTGRCLDCVGLSKVCAVTTIIERRPGMTDMHVIIVNDDLGLSWDRGWPEERISRIIKNHEEYMNYCPLPPFFIEEGTVKRMWDMYKSKDID